MLKSCGVVPVREVGGSFQYLLLENHSHWDFPKGGTEPGETDLECATRELAEESALTSPDFRWGLNSYTTEPYSKPRKTATYFVAWFSPDAEVKLLPNPSNGIIEHQAFKWASYEEALKLTKPRIQKALEFARQTVEGQKGIK